MDSKTADGLREVYKKRYARLMEAKSGNTPLVASSSSPLRVSFRGGISYGTSTLINALMDTKMSTINSVSQSGSLVPIRYTHAPHSRIEVVWWTMDELKTIV